MIATPGCADDRGQPAERRVDGLVGAVAGARQRGIDALALDVEQDRILERRRKHAAFFETDDEDERAAGEAGGRERRDVEVTGPRAIGADVHALDALAEESQRLVERTAERRRARASSPIASASDAAAIASSALARAA